MFVFRHDYWAFNLKTSRYSAPGAYTMSLVSGNNDEYTVTTSCVKSFIVK
ncbi:hypothetical protein [Shewanella surugensis]|uniref:PKD domain-containing protein n=1 Tax=Shewanella surugensis TaxID=212020 RepID=A0ABT0LGQ4_9GAMM|nr:hypothetical protein [Shewanella surugensis]MCL1126883.1 hypothetical protein [Shewanella surugensis]